MDSERVTKNRQSMQDFAVDLSTRFGHVLLSWATGVGKSLAAIRIIDNDINRSTNDTGDWSRWYIVCAEKQHIENWKEQFRQHGYEKLLELGYVEIFCYQSLHKYKDKEANLVLDEAHGVTDLRLDILKTIKAEKIISLSATVNEERKQQLRELRPFYEYSIDVDTAIRAGILPKPVIVKVEFSLSANLRRAYDTYESKIREEEKQNAYRLIDHFRPQPTIDALQNGINMDEAIAHALNLKLARKTLLANSKTIGIINLARQIISTHNKRMIIFGGTRIQCIKIHKSIPNSTLVLSSLDSKLSQRHVDDFNQHKVDRIIALKMLRQGTNLEDIEAGIIAQLDSKELSFVQMMGRVFRSSAPVLYVCVVKDTVDEIYWQSCIRGLDESYIVNFNDYKYG